eukprot:m.3415 g.3415  ORF g.3415 m.3415 type:complete len:2425 (+) comp9369_c0_seq1:116-7390(+)
MLAKVGGLLVCLALLLCPAQSQPESNLTVGGTPDFEDLVRMNRPPPFFSACMSPDSVTTNFAAGMAVTMSTTSSAAAGGALATDGVVNQKCAKTKSQANPFLMVDMGQASLVGRVTINFPTTGNFQGMEIRIGDDSTNGGANTPICKTLTTKPSQITIVYCDPPLTGRYLTLRIPGANKIVAACEVIAVATCANQRVCSNLALKQPTRQSTTGWSGSSGRAVDGNRNGNYNGGRSCTHTLGQTNPWWYVDLGFQQPVRKITVTNRGDCCHTRLNGFEIWVGDDNTSGGTKNKKCTAKAIPNFGRGETRTITCDSLMHGRYVFVRIPGGGKVLTICEVAVYSDCSLSPLPCTTSGCARGQSSNVALNLPSAQSSNYNSVFISSLANNGNYYAHINYCTHTKTQTDPWWRVDLGCLRTVSLVTVTNRGDCCETRLNGFKVAIGNDASNGGMNNPICGAGVNNIGRGWTVGVPCPNLKGRFVSVYLKGGNKILTICEVQVFEYCDQECYNLALGQTVSSASPTISIAQTSYAVDGNRNTNFWSRSCYLSNTVTNPFFTVDLGHVRQVGKVRVFNRGDCTGCQNELDNFEVRVGFNPDGTKNALCYTGSTKQTVYKNQALDVMCNANRMGQYVSVIRIGSGKRLSLCEIEVYETGMCNDRGCYNHAQGRGAAISSLYSGRWPASKVVDGDYWSKNINSNKCTHSRTQTNPWFRVDLWQEVIVTKIYIANRGDCCGDRMTNFELRVGNSLVNSGNSNPTCRRNLPTMATNQYASWNCPEMQGRFVNLLIRKTGAVMNFCELQVCGRLPINTAHGKPTMQSTSRAGGGASSRAVDGNPAPNWNSASCTHSNAEKNPWWRVDLLEERRVTSVRVTNRGDCCWDRLNGFEIRIGNSLDFEGNNNAKCIPTAPNIGKGATTTILCGSNGAGLNGRYVNILLPGDNKVLTLCEVAVVSTSVGKCMLSGRWKPGCGGYCDAGKGGVGCHSCPAGKVGRVRHIDSGLCFIPDKNLTYPYNSLRPVMSDKCDGMDSLFLFSESGLFYHIPSGYCLHIDAGGFNPKDGQELVFWNSCNALDSRLQFDILSEGHLKNRRTKECVRVKDHVPSVGSKLAMYKDCATLAADYEFTIDEDAGKRWSVAINIATDDARFNYMSDMWFNTVYFGNASDLSKNAFLRAYDNVLVDYLSVQINNVEKIVNLPDNVRGKYTLKDLVLREGILSMAPALKGQLDAFNFKTSSPPVAYCTNEGFNYQQKEQQKWLNCQSYARIGIPLNNAVSTGIFQLGYNNKCIHVNGGGYTSPGDGTTIVAWSGCLEERMRYTYRADNTFQHSTGKCLGFSVAKPVKGTPIVFKQCGAAAKFTWRSDGAIVYSTNPLLCWAVEGIPTGIPGNGKKIILSDVCDPKKNPIYKFTFLKAGYNTPCQRPTSVEGVGLFHGCNMKSLSSGRMLNGATIFKRAVVRVYGRPSCNRDTSDGCAAQMGYCSCKNGYFGASCEYQCPDGRFGKLCRQTCRCQNSGKCDFKTGACDCPCGWRGNLCQFPCNAMTYGAGCNMQCNCSVNAAGCDACSGQCLCKAGYGGSRCDQTCGAGLFAGMWGPGCLNKCQCKYGSCHPSTGKCTCSPGYTGAICEAMCQRNFFGKDCGQVCACHHSSSCNHVTGACNCSAGFFGVACDRSCIEGQCGQSCVQTCGCSNGKCDGVTCQCTCDAGWTGAKCDKVCPGGSYGLGCTQICKCHSQAQCNEVDGTCTCPPGKSGLLCDKPCTATHFGKDCAQTCACKNGACDPVTGACTCTLGWTGAACDVSCSAGKFGDRCNETCSCGAHATPEMCNHISGDCICLKGWFGVRCDSQCSAANKWGAGCSQTCTCKNSGSCDQTTGACECKPGYIGSDCGQTCSAGKFGVGCQYSCTCIQGNSQCDPVDGTCSCQPGWRGHDCDLPCTTGTYGQDCALICTCSNGRCDPASGQCQCDNGWAGSDCSQRCPNGTYGLKCISQCQCDPTATCNAVDGTCTCAPGMQGKYCTHNCHGYFGHDCLAKCPPCGPNVVSVGDCHPVNGQCQCSAGYSGVLCQDPCTTGTWGAGCTNQCKCKNGDCDPLTGACTCNDGFTGLLCDATCPDNFFGENCQFKCACSHSKKTCDPVTGACSCPAGWQPDLCAEPCPSGRYGVDCQNQCSCRNGECDPVLGACSCIAGFMGDDCGAPCNSSTWGPNCLYNCNECENYQVCEPNTGNCSCGPGWIGDECANSCPLGKYGLGCQYDCECQFNGVCDHVTGGCNCTAGFWGAVCENVGCPNGTWGPVCQQNCDCLAQQECSFITGECFYPQSYFDSQSKIEDDSSSLSTAEIGIIVGSIVGGLVLIVVIVLVFLYAKGSNTSKTPAAMFTNEGDVTFGGPDDFGGIKDEARDGFTNPMYGTSTLKNSMYDDPIKNNPTYAEGSETADYDNAEN